MNGKEKSMRRISRLWARFVSEDKGLETVEYAIMTGLIVTATIVAIGALGLWVSGRFEAVLKVLGG
jgi:Flp pilus assembly pilin Flp